MTQGPAAVTVFFDEQATAAIIFFDICRYKNYLQTKIIFLGQFVIKEGCLPPTNLETPRLTPLNSLKNFRILIPQTFENPHIALLKKKLGRSLNMQLIK